MAFGFLSDAGRGLGNIGNTVLGKNKLSTTTPNYRKEWDDREQAMSEETRGQQQQFGEQLAAAARGEGPSAAQAQLTAGKQAAIRAGTSAAASARGSGVALAGRTAGQVAGQATMGAAANSAALRAQEQQAAMGQYSNLLQTQRMQDLQARGLTQAEAQGQLQAELGYLQSQTTIGEGNAARGQQGIGSMISSVGAAFGVSDPQAKGPLTPVGAPTEAAPPTYGAPDPEGTAARYQQLYGQAPGQEAASQTETAGFNNLLKAQYGGGAQPPLPDNPQMRTVNQGLDMQQHAYTPGSPASQFAGYRDASGQIMLMPKETGGKPSIDGGGGAVGAAAMPAGASGPDGPHPLAAMMVGMGAGLQGQDSGAAVRNLAEAYRAANQLPPGQAGAAAAPVVLPQGKVGSAVDIKQPLAPGAGDPFSPANLQPYYPGAVGSAVDIKQPLGAPDPFDPSNLTPANPQNPYGKAFAGALSDPSVKDPAQDDAEIASLQATPDNPYPVADAAAKVQPQGFRYKSPEFAATGTKPRVGAVTSGVPGALVDNPLWKASVFKGPDGIERVDSSQASMSTIAAVSDVAKQNKEQESRIKNLEAALAAAGGEARELGRQAEAETIGERRARPRGEAMTIGELDSRSDAIVAALRGSGQPQGDANTEMLARMARPVAKKSSRPEAMTIGEARSLAKTRGMPMQEAYDAREREAITLSEAEHLAKTRKLPAQDRQDARDKRQEVMTLGEMEYLKKRDKGAQKKGDKGGALTQALRNRAKLQKIGDDDITFESQLVETYDPSMLPEPENTVDTRYEDYWTPAKRTIEAPMDVARIPLAVGVDQNEERVRNSAQWFGPIAEGDADFLPGGSLVGRSRSDGKLYWKTPIFEGTDIDRLPRPKLLSPKQDAARRKLFQKTRADEDASADRELQALSDSAATSLEGSPAIRDFMIKQLYRRYNDAVSREYDDKVRQATPQTFYQFLKSSVPGLTMREVQDALDSTEL